MSAMPALAPSAQAAVSEARGTVAAKPPAPPLAQAPEFEGVAVRAAPATRSSQTVRTADGARETRTEGLIIRLPPESADSEDVGSGADAPAGNTPAASVQDLMSRVGGE